MAEIKKVVRGNPLSSFRQAAPEAGGAFRFLADAADQAYEFLKPAAMEEMDAYGQEVGREIARQQIGDPKGSFTVSTMGAPAGAAPMTGDFDFTPYVTEGGARPDAITGLSGDFRGGLASMLAAAPEHIRGQLKIGSAYRSPERQEELWQDALKKYGSPEAARKWVAPPGNSKHNHGQAADLKFGSDEAKAWVHANAGQFGMTFPMAHEPWHIEPVGARGGSVTASTMGSEMPAPTMLREADGKLTARLFSPLSGPLLQASNAAAGVAYTSDVMLKGMTDIMDLSNQFQLDPEGFAEAARSYVDDMVKAAPEQFRGDVRASLEKEMQRRVLGLHDERQRDIRQRADNSSRALAERWGDNLADALVGGNPDEIAAARAELDSVLRARESLPGVAWTPEQSGNVIIEAERKAEKARQSAQNEQKSAWKSALDTITDAAKAGRSAVDEAILSNPLIADILPDEFAKASAFVALRDNLPSFMRMTPTEQIAALEEMKAQPIASDWEVGLYGAAEEAAAANAKAWEEDPIKRAGEILPQKPPAMPTIEEAMQDPTTISQSLGARVAYAEGLKAQGYTDFLSVFTDEEATAFGALMGKGTPPEVKAALAGAIVAAAGENAVSVFKEIKTTDPVTLHAGMLMARGGDTVVPTMAMVGQARLDEGLVQPPAKATRIEAASPEIAQALAALPNAPKVGGDTLKFATAIFAAQVPPNGLDEQGEKELMASSLQMALGQATNKRGDLTGGVQTVGGSPVLLPPKMSGEKLNAALEMAFTSPATDVGFLGRLAMVGGYDHAKPDAALWTASGAGSVPMLGGEPVKADLLRRGNVQLIPAGGNMYRLSLRIGDQIVDARNAAGGPFVFDAQKLIEAVK